jgi:hypothetical protein
MQNDQQSTRQNSNPFIWVAIVLFALATGAFGFLYFDQKKTSEQQEVTINEKARQLAFTQTKMDSVSAALDSRIAEVQKLGGDITELETVRKRLEADKVALRKGNRIEIAKYTAKIKEYEAFMVEKDVEIAKLREENGVLIATNTTLNTENTGLKTEKETLTQAKQALTDTLTTVSSRNQELTEKVSLGASLKAQNLKVLAVNTKGKVKEDDAYKAKRVDKIRLQFTLPENPLTKQEEKEIVVRVLDPDGAVLSDEAIGSGKFNAKNGEEMVFTTKGVVPFTNNNQLVELTYDKSDKFRPGKYNVELYSEGYRIGQGNFTIR